jgi:acyl-CoA synthetase (AMP-forming)/AMP-acid ligase II
MDLTDLTNRWAKLAGSDAVIWRDQTYSYGWLIEKTTHFNRWLNDAKITPGTVVSLEADYSPNSIALLLALIERRAIIVPLTMNIEERKAEFRALAGAETRLVIQADSDLADSCPLPRQGDPHSLIRQLRRDSHPGLILFSSGSTGVAKGVVHDLTRLFEKFQTIRHAKRTVTFLMFDHIGGIDTLFYTLFNGGCLITAQDRSPEAICWLVQQHRVEVLPVSPTFINLMLLSEAYRRHDLSSLQIVTYGAEVMPESVLKRFHEVLPQVRTLQKYGLTELGALRSKSRADDSVWVKIGGEGYEIRVVDGLLQIKARSAMLGYLNAASPFTDDGWFQTGDLVQVDGDWLRILGRKSDMINVGGEKVLPTEVESVLQMMDGVQEAVVRGEPNPLTGNIVVATVTLRTDETPDQFRVRLRRFCKDKLPPHKIPQKVIIDTGQLHTDRYKKRRLATTETN